LQVGLSIDGLIYPAANSEAEGMNIVLRKELVDENLLWCDLVVMYSMQRNPSNRKQIVFSEASNSCIPDAAGNLKFNAIW
jgi:hypothetical protein